MKQNLKIENTLICWNLFSRISQCAMVYGYWRNIIVCFFQVKVSKSNLHTLMKSISLTLKRTLK